MIQASTLQPEQIDAIIPALLQQSLINHKSDKTADELITIIKRRIFSEEFLGKFATPFEDNFSHEEIKKLIGFYKSEEMRKFYKFYTQFCGPIFPAVSEIVDEVVQSSVAKVPSIADDNVIVITQENYQQEVKKCDQPIVLDVYSTFCGPCKAIAPIISELSNELSGKVKFIKLNIEKDPTISQELGIGSVPTLLFIKDGKILDRHVGVIQKNELDKKIKKTFQ